MTHPEPSAEPQQLRSWKEIADYLGVSVRTAQLWEQERGLPVKRWKGSRGSVFCALEDIQRWRQVETFAAEKIQPRRRWVWAIGAGAFAATLLAVAAWRLPGSAGRVESCEVAGDSLIVKDSDGRELWRHSFNGDLFLFDYNASDQGLRRWWVGDLDGDGSPEVLFAYRPANHGRNTALICYSSTGRERWRFEAGHSVWVAGEEYAPPYTLENFEVFPHRGRNLIVASSHQRLYFPNQVALISPEGKLISEYWHSGFLPALTVADVDGDGEKEILAAGVSNANRAATLVVLRPDGVKGASDENRSKYQISGYPPAEEKARIVLPETCIVRKQDSYSSVSEIQVRKADILVLTQGREHVPGVAFRLSPDLRVLDASVVDSFKARHREMFERGELDHRFTAEEERKLADVMVLRAPYLAKASRRNP